MLRMHTNVATIEDREQNGLKLSAFNCAKSPKITNLHSLYLGETFKVCYTECVNLII